jgi:hypothetical protein
MNWILAEQLPELKRRYPKLLINDGIAGRFCSRHKHPLSACSQGCLSTIRLISRLMLSLAFSVARQTVLSAVVPPALACTG